ncbi:MAG: hypothetical protein OXC62_03720 [Aestuariivita sp.]|nr:hypothetical protein [Aestuariivita sp.]
MTFLQNLILGLQAFGIFRAVSCDQNLPDATSGSQRPAYPYSHFYDPSVLSLPEQHD